MIPYVQAITSKSVGDGLEDALLKSVEDLLEDFSLQRV
jgi:hypothetical protein